MNPKPHITEFIDLFPEMPLPISITHDTHYFFSKNNAPVSKLMHDHFLQVYDGRDSDAYTEYVACFRIPETFDIHALVYWRANLDGFEYIMISLDKQGKLIEKKIIGRMHMEGDQVIQSVINIEDDWIIYSVEGLTHNAGEPFDPSATKTTNFELLPDGQIIIL